ncbi:hypothetical protein Godav_023751 [Gossypium davidsonii]|uniref:Uncharacterized protein n=2 Tax=Gossypium TaxID=3633 RepID=A0A7J8SSQ8_GOSDV|nr:hypothetical protein [Gossypium davidsonii]MBA0664837.1 hypothetical protein [Gossypium klotzschianum]
MVENNYQLQERNSQGLFTKTT